MNNINLFKNKIFISINTILFYSILVFGRPLLGLYIFGFRIGEYLVGLGILYIFYVLFNYRFFVKKLNRKFLLSYLGLITYFFINIIFDNSNSLTTFSFQTSAYIWYMSYFLMGIAILPLIKINQNFFYFGYFGLLCVYILNLFFYPKFLIDFFLNYSDKFDFAKASEISIFYIFVTFFSITIFQSDKNLNLFTIFSGLMLPVIIFKSRSAGIAVIIYFLLMLYINRYKFKRDYKKNLSILMIFILLFTFTSHRLVDNIFSFLDSDEAVANVFKHKYVTSNTLETEKSIFYIVDNRIFSADGNLNWRLQLWQDILNDLKNENKIFNGLGFKSKIPTFNQPIYSGLDGTNHNSHNYFLNVFTRSGLIGFFLLMLLLFNQLKLTRPKYNFLELTSYLFPIFFISMFDGSMENPYFGILYYFSLSLFFINIRHN